MKQLLERTNISQKREDRFDQSALIPGAFGTELEIIRHALLAAKTEITQGDGLPFVAFDERQKTVVASVGCGPLPIHHTPVLINDPAQLDAHDPTPIAFAFLADLLLGTAFADRVNEFNAVAIGDGKEGRCVEKTLCPVPMCGEQALHACATGQARKQMRELALKPAVKVPKASALEREQGADSNHFTRIKFTLRVFGHEFHAIINGAKEMCNNVFGLHEHLQENGFGHYIFPV